MYSPYAWKIDRDHLAEDDPEWPSHEGTTGPRESGGIGTYLHSNRFYMYDDDDILYVTGTLFWNSSNGPDEECLSGPLRDFGRGLGCVRVEYSGHPEWTIG